MAEATRLDRSFVERWSALYVSKATPWRRLAVREVDPLTAKGWRDLEEQLLTEVGPLAAKRGYFRREELSKVIWWKGDHIFLENYSDDEIHTITREALAAPAYLRHWILQRLDGVKVQSASAILTVWDPKSFLVFTPRTLRSLTGLGELPEGSGDASPDYPKQAGTLLDYPTYLECCRTIAQRLGVEMLDLERALWQWEQEGQPTPAF